MPLSYPPRQQRTKCERRRRSTSARLLRSCNSSCLETAAKLGSGSRIARTQGLLVIQPLTTARHVRLKERNVLLLNHNLTWYSLAYSTHCTSLVRNRGVRACLTICRPRYAFHGCPETLLLKIEAKNNLLIGQPSAQVHRARNLSVEYVRRPR